MIGVERGEAALVLSMFAHLLLISVARAYLSVSSYSLFVSELGASSLPQAYLATGVVLVVVSFAYIRLQRRLQWRFLFAATLAFVAFFSLVCRFFAAEPGGGWSVLILPVWYETMWVLTNIEFWSLATHLFDPGQGKRLFGILAAGRPAGEILAGLLTPWLTSLLGTANLFLVSAAITALNLGLLYFIFRLARPLPQRSSAPLPLALLSGEGNLWRRFRGGRYAWLILAHVAGCWFAFFILDRIFYDYSSTRYPYADELTSILGTVLWITAVAGFLGSLLTTRLIIRRIGIENTVFMMPLALIVASILAAYFAISDPGMDKIFFAILNG